METKKISFGFSKSNKKPNLVLNKESQKSEANKVELIKCLEGQEIKLVEEKPEEAPLIIPLKENQKTSAALASLIKRRAVLLGEDESTENATQKENGEKPKNLNANAPENIEERAAKELLAELNDGGSQTASTNLVLPIVHPDDLPLEGAKESNMDDYDNIPIEMFGKAMLRGMGWVEPPPPTKGGPPLDDTPMVRPKGMGLGADKALKAKPLLVAPESNEVLEIKRNAYVRILGGKHKDLYGQIEGFDDHAGRVIVKMAIGGFKEAFNEFLCQPVAKKEYAQYGKCINSSKYEEYKRKENEFGQIILKKEELMKIEKASIKYEKIKKEKLEPSSDEDCKIIDRKPIKEEINSREKRDYYESDQCVKNERDRNRGNNGEDERERSRVYHKDEERQTKRENIRDYDDKDHKRDNYRDDEKHKQGNGQGSSHERSREVQRNNEKPHDNSRERNRDYQKGNHYERSRNREGDRYRERSRERPESSYANDERKKIDHTSDQKRQNKDKKKDYEERKCRQRRGSTSDESETDDGSKHKKYNKDKKFRKKSKKSKKGKSKYQDSSCDSESCSSDLSDSSDSEAKKRHKKHKKKTKKSKKQRERSRSRGRR